MSEERKKVLEMLAAGKITAEEAEKLLDKLSSNASNETAGAKTPPASAATGTAKPKYLRIVVDQPGHKEVNVRDTSFLCAFRERPSRHNAEARERTPRGIRHQRGLLHHYGHQ